MLVVQSFVYTYTSVPKDTVLKDHHQEQVPASGNNPGASACRQAGPSSAGSGGSARPASAASAARSSEAALGCDAWLAGGNMGRGRDAGQCQVCSGPVKGSIFPLNQREVCQHDCRGLSSWYPCSGICKWEQLKLGFVTQRLKLMQQGFAVISYGTALSGRIWDS